MISDKLNKQETTVMDTVFALSEGKERILIAPYDLLAALPARAKFDEEKLERVLRDLEMDGYFELTLSDRKGEKMYVINLRNDGLNYKRTDYQRKRGVYFKLGLAAAGAVVAFLVGVILKAIF